MKRAFTLIELLVVIAIIAILAAILFPVFAQAKEAAKKTATLASAKQYGTAINIYLSDSDDTLPLGYTTTAGGNIRYATWTPFPSGWFNDGGGWSSPVIMNQTDSYWINACLPYVKNGQITEITGAQSAQAVTADFALPRLKQPFKMGYSFNGLLSGYSATAAVSPSTNPLLWTGFGKLNMEGRALTNPNLQCNGTAGASCRFNPDAAPMAGASTDWGDTWFWGTASFSSPASYSPPAALYGGNKVIVVRLDSSAKVQTVTAPGTTGARDVNTIFTSVAATGNPTDMKACRFSATGTYYTAFFRPDYDGSGRSAFTNTGGGCDE